MTRRLQLRPERRLIFAGCEGSSEQAYVALLNALANSRARSLFFRPFILKPGAGDPLSLVELAKKRYAERLRRGEKFIAVAIFLDEDKCSESPSRCARANTLARDAGIRLVWQRPNHEALLLRHLDGCRDLKPSPSKSEATLRRYWPDYRKPMVAQDLARRIDAEGVRRACIVEAELADLLRAIGWLDG